MTGGYDSTLRVCVAIPAIPLLCSTPSLGVLIPTQAVNAQHNNGISALTQETPLSSARPFDYILIILMENKNFNQINGSSSASYNS